LPFLIPWLIHFDDEKDEKTVASDVARYNEMDGEDDCNKVAADIFRETKRICVKRFSRGMKKSYCFYRAPNVKFYSHSVITGILCCRQYTCGLFTDFTKQLIPGWLVPGFKKSWVFKMKNIFLDLNQTFLIEIRLFIFIKIVFSRQGFTEFLKLVCLLIAQS